jgi:hypothetical protein
VLAASETVHATPGQIHEVTQPQINLRAGPGADTKVMRTLEAGDRVMEFARKGRWYRVKQMGRVGPEGWVRGDMIAPEVLPAPEPEFAPDAGRGPTGEVQPERYVDEDDGRYYTYPRFHHGRRALRNRAFLPWGVTVKHKRRDHKKGKKERHRGHDDAKTRRSSFRPGRAVRGTSRNLGGPRGGGARNIGTF